VARAGGVSVALPAGSADVLTIREAATVEPEQRKIWKLGQDESLIWRTEEGQTLSGSA
jgi:hypothetical protein